MNSLLVRVRVKQVGLLALLVAVVALLTLLFTFLGTITCAVLTGVMMGTTRHRRWQTFPVSLVFPGVVLLLLRVWKSELTGQQNVEIAAVCFGAFWVPYLVTRVLAHFERKEERAPAKDRARESAVVAAPSAAAEPVAELSLDQLQGKWSCETTGPDGQIQKKVIEIANSSLKLRVTDSGGRICFSAKAGVKLEQ